MTSFTHLNAQGEANMVDVSDKAVTRREATAQGYLYASAEVISGIANQTLKKGDVLAVARIAGIQGAKRCSDLIPLCHPLPLTKVGITLTPEPTASRIEVTCLCRTTGQTGVEMEALTGATVALLTLYDMCKALDKTMRIEHVQVTAKSGGKSGDWSREAGNDHD